MSHFLLTVGVLINVVHNMKLLTELLARRRGNTRSNFSHRFFYRDAIRRPSTVIGKLARAIHAFFLHESPHFERFANLHWTRSVSFPTLALVIGLGLSHGVLALPAMTPLSDQLQGSWFVESAAPEGMIVQVVTFKERGQKIYGTWETLPRWLTGEIDQVKLKNGILSFTLALDGDTASWRGEFHGDETFSMTWIRSDGVPVLTRVFRRASKEALTEAESRAPKDLVTHTLPLPRIQKLPFNGLALTPPMGWNSWNFFKEGVDDKSVREIVDALVKTGLRDAGYTIVTIDDGWQGDRDAAGVIHANTKFPDMRALGEYIHDRGLKFGIYSSPGPITCAGYIGSHGHETEDVRTFISWGVDFLKYDWCFADAVYKTRAEMQSVYQKMGAALQASARPIIYSLCQYGAFDVGSWGRDVGGNLWRTGGDTIEGNRWASMSSRFNLDGDAKDNGPGGWNDPDMMLVGIDGMNVDEYRTHMTLWSMLAAPLIIGNDVRSMSAEVRDILVDKEVLEVDQDVLGRQGSKVRKFGTSEIWVKPLSNGAMAIAFFNRGEEPATIQVRWADLRLGELQQVRDLWRKLDLGTQEGGISASVPRHGSVLLRVTAVH